MQRLCEVVLIHLCLSQMAVALVDSTGFQTRSLLQTASTHKNITVTIRTATQSLWLTMVSIVSYTFNIMWAYHTHSTSCDYNHTLNTMITSHTLHITVITSHTPHHRDHITHTPHHRDHITHTQLSCDHVTHTQLSCDHVTHNYHVIMSHILNIMWSYHTHSTSCDHISIMITYIDAGVYCVTGAHFVYYICSAEEVGHVIELLSKAHSWWRQYV